MTLGLLFDLDGTMADTDPVHFAAFNALLGEHGKSITLEAYKADVLGGSNPVIMRGLFPEFDTERHVELANRKETLFRSKADRLLPLEGLLDLLAEAVRHGSRIGVVTNAPRLNAEHTLRALGLDHLLPTIVVGEEIARSKPDPLPYLTGLDRLGCPADRAIAFEDSIAGVTAASAADLYTVAIRTSLPTDLLLAAGADLAIDDYRDPALLALMRRAIGGGEIRRRAR